MVEKIDVRIILAHALEEGIMAVTVPNKRNPKKFYYFADTDVKK